MSGRGPQPAHRLRPAAFALVVAALFVVATAGWLALRITGRSDRAPVLADPGYRAGLAVDALVDRGPGLHAGDTVVAVDGVAIDDWLRGARPRPAVDASDVVEYRVVRDGRSATVRVAVHDGVVTHERLREAQGIVFAALTILVLGAWCTYRRPERPAARALLVLGAGLVAYTAFTIFGYDTTDVVADPPVFAFGFIGAVASLVAWSLAGAQLALTFPDPPAFMAGHRWLVPAVHGAALAATAGVTAAIVMSGRASLHSLDAANTVTSAVLTLLVLTTVGAVVRTLLRARHDPVVRAQGALVAAGLAATITVLAAGNLVAPDSKWPPWVDAAAFLPLPLTIAVALLRGEFLGLRAVVNRTLVYGALTAVLLGAYALSAVVVGGIAGGAGLAPTLFASAVVAIAFAPARASLQHRVDRLLYGERGDPARVLGALGRRLESAVPPGEVLPAIVETVATTLNLPYVALRTGVDDDARLAYARGDAGPDLHVVPLVHQGVTVGELVVAARRGERGVRADDRTLLADIARQVAAAVSAASLLTDLTASRSRLAVAREEERARVRHDLHDRLGPHLVGLSLQLDALERRVDDDTVAHAVGRAREEAARALDEVRRIARGLRPAELDELGLVEAIAAAAARLTVDDGDGWTASVDAALHLGVVPPGVEAAAYQIALEALTNAHRHSGGRTASIRLFVDAGATALTLDVADDGHGIADAATNRRAGRDGVGIRSMHERAAAVGGRLTLGRTADGGTLVRATLPLPTAPPSSPSATGP